MSYIVSWDGPSADEPDRGNEVPVTTLSELDAVLDQVASYAAARKLPYAVQVDKADAPGSVMIGIGHPDRSFIDWLMPKGRRQYAFDPDIPEPAESTVFDVYGEWHEHEPEESRVRPEAAREAAREYLRTGQRPTCAQWLEDC